MAEGDTMREAAELLVAALVRMTEGAVDSSTPPSSSDVLLYTVEQAAELLAVGRSTVYELIAQRKLTAVKIGGSRRIRRADLEQFVDSL